MTIKDDHYNETIDSLTSELELCRELLSEIRECLPEKVGNIAYPRSWAYVAIDVRHELAYRIISYIEREDDNANKCDVDHT